jgi:peptidoglycan/xylan/chitin deacetylase (PgdA/CDA1 family)
MGMDTKSNKISFQNSRELEYMNLNQRFPYSSNIYRTVRRKIRRQALFLKLTLDNLWYKYNHASAESNRIVCIVFDDGWKSQLNALPTLDKYSFKATFAVIPGFVDAGKDKYLSWQQIYNLNAEGHDIESHTLNHQRLDELNYQELQTEISGSQKSLNAHGIDTRILIYPWGLGYKSKAVRLALSEAGYLMARNTQPGQFNLALGDKFAVNSFAMDGDTSMKTFAKYLRGTGGDQVTVLLYHKVGQDGVSVSQFAQEMTYLYENKFTIKTLKQLLAEAVGNY